jgi:hypothetical protein
MRDKAIHGRTFMHIKKWKPCLGSSLVPPLPLLHLPNPSSSFSPHTSCSLKPQSPELSLCLWSHLWHRQLVPLLPLLSSDHKSEKAGCCVDPTMEYPGTDKTMETVRGQSGWSGAGWGGMNRGARRVWGRETTLRYCGGGYLLADICRNPQNAQHPK